MKRRKLSGLLAALMVAFALLPTVAMAVPPEPVGLTPVSQDAITNFGSLVGENGSSHAACTVNGVNLLVTTGDFTAYRDPQGVSRSALRAVVTNADTGAFLWGANGVNGWVQTSACANGYIYFGGSFTTFQNTSRLRTAAIDATTFALTSWQSSFNSGAVWNIKSSDSGDLYVAGLDAVRRVTVAGVQVWSRSFDCGVRTVLPVGSSVYVGGVFDNIKRPGTTSVPARGLAVLDSATGAPLSTQPAGSLPNGTRCAWTGANPLSLAYDSLRDNIFVCEGGGLNRARSVDVTTGENVWHRETAGDAQVCVNVQGHAFIGFHRSGANVDQSITPNKGTMGMMVNGDDGTQEIWEPAPDFVGAGANRDGRNNGIIGAVYFNDRLYITGAFKTVDGLAKPKLAAFAVNPE